MRVDYLHERRVPDRKERLRADCRTPDLLQDLTMRGQGNGREILAPDAGFFVCQKSVEDVGTRASSQGKRESLAQPICGEFFGEAERARGNLRSDARQTLPRAT